MDLMTGLKLLFPPWWCDVINDSNLSYASKRVLTALVIIVLAAFWLWVLARVLLWAMSLAD